MDEVDTINHVGVIGATSLVGGCLLPLLAHSGWRVTAYSRQTVGLSDDGGDWRQFSRNETAALQSSAQRAPQAGEKASQYWICAAAIWVLPEHFALLEAHGAKRVVVLSSTSRFTKDDSTDSAEQAIARRLTDSEARVQARAESKGVEWVILRPTLIYGLGRDKNIAEIARFVRRFGFFPLLDRARGLRQPIYVEDVATACLAALNSPVAANHAYNISGGEALSYREMVCRVFAALGKRPRLVSVPLWVFWAAVAVVRLLPRYRHWTVEMAERMNRDLVFDHADAVRDLGFAPRPFRLSPEDLPV